jgi:hypothetical protein
MLFYGDDEQNFGIDLIVPHKMIHSLENFMVNVFLQSLTILASIPAGILIFSLFLLLLYLMTRCCDRKSKKQRTFGCQKCTLIFITILTCGAIGGGT